MRVTKKTLLRKIDLMEKAAKRYGVTFQTVFGVLHDYRGDIVAHYDFKDNFFHKTTVEANDEMRAALETAMYLLGVNEKYDRMSQENKEDDGFAEQPLRYFLDDLLIVAEAQKAESAATAEQQKIYAAKIRLTGKS